MRPDRKKLLLPFLFLAACTSPQAEIEDGQYQLANEAPQLVEQDPATQEANAGSAAELIQAKGEKNALVAQSYVNMGDDAFERGDFVGAGVHYAEAARLDASSVAARDGMRRSQLAAADQPYDIDSAENALDEATRRAQAQRMRVEGLVREGDIAMGQGDFQTAVERYTMSTQALSYNPNLAYGYLENSLVQSKLDEAVAARNSADQATRSANAQGAAAEASAAVAAQDAYTANLIASHLNEANEKFLQGFPTDAVTVLDRLLRIDPGNEDAIYLRSVALESAHQNRQDSNSSRFSEEWQRTFEDLRHLAVPPKNNFGFDEKIWEDVVSKRKPLDQVEDDAEMDPIEASIRYSLANTKIVPNFDDTLEEILPNLQAFSKVNFQISRAVMDDIDEDVKTIRMPLKQAMSVDRILRIMEDLMGNEVKFVVRFGAVWAMTAEEADTEAITKIYEVRDIVRPVKDFPLKEFNLVPSGGIDAEEEEMPEPEATILGDDELLTMITESIDPDSWDGEAHSANIENGTLTVHHSPEVQAEIAQMLGDLRVPANIMVDIKVRFMRVEDSFLQDVGVDFRGLGNDSTSGAAGKGDDLVFDDFGTDFGSSGDPGRIGTGADSGMIYREANSTMTMLARSENLYDNGLGDDGIMTNAGGLAMQYTWLDDAQLEMILQAVRKSKRSELVVEPSLMVYNTARANLVVANQVSYVSDFDVEIASSAAIADPIVRVANDGVYLDVRPVVTADRRFVWIDVRPTVANLQRPIPTLQTSLGVGSPVTLMLPELELQKIRTRAILPDGGTLLLGGMNVIKEQEMVSGIPFLSSIPVLSFFFSRKGTYESYQKLIILLTANIILPEEHEPEKLPAGF
jgi:type II secretory pathway component GspD/PulD (secretin)